ncbi:MAG: hypothetical protein OJF49_004232 [Ktedonobacterales bacterium]|nr:MAG: hypothetical protein OJF49_004232 [Ktedonobacterales bacterium]
MLRTSSPLPTPQHKRAADAFHLGGATPAYQRHASGDFQVQ